MRKLGDELSNPQFFELINKREGSRSDRIWKYYIILKNGVQQSSVDLHLTDGHQYDMILKNGVQQPSGYSHPQVLKLHDVKLYYI